MLEHIRSLLASSDPYTLVGSAAVAVFFLVLTWRKLSPGSWNWLEKQIPWIDRIESNAVWTFAWKTVQTIPGMLLGALVTGVASGGDVKKTLLGVLAGPVAAIGHEALKAYKGAPSKPGDRGLPPQSYAVLVGSALGLAAAFALNSCANWKPVAKSVDQAAIILCDVFFSQQPQAVGLNPEEVEKAFCSTAEQVAPFLESANKAMGRAGAVRLSRPEK